MQEPRENDPARARLSRGASSRDFTTASSASTGTEARRRSPRWPRGGWRTEDLLHGHLTVAPAQASATAPGDVADAVPAGRADFAPPARASAWSLLEASSWARLQLLVDLFMLAAATAVALAVAQGAAPQGTSRAIWAYPSLVLALLFVRGGFVHRPAASAVDVMLGAAAAVSLATMVYVTAATFVGSAPVDVSLMGWLWGFSLLLLAGGRAAVLLGQRRARSLGRVGDRVLIVGDGSVGRRLARRLAEHPEYGLVPVGMLDHPGYAEGERLLPLVGAPDDVVQAASQLHARHVILAFPQVPDSELVPLVRRCEAAGVEISLVPRFFESLNDRLDMQRLGALPLMSLRSVDPKGWQFEVKYKLDRWIAGALLLMLSPLLVLIALAVKLSSPGPVFFRQRRVGLDGAAFDLLKFRSMRVSDDRNTQFLPHAGLAPGGIEGHDRRTGIGRLLRRTFLDEVPQLVNVVRGEMSLVGPRPERPEFVDMFGPRVTRYGDRHRTKSGITGWAQVNGLRGQTSLADRVEYDNHYIDNWSFGLDLKIVLLTMFVMVFSNDKSA